MKHTKKHFHVPGANEISSVNMEEEVQMVASNHNVRVRVDISGLCIMFIAMQCPLVENVEDLDTLADRLDALSRGKEFGFSPIFSPELVDESCRRGIFPLAICIKNNIYHYAPKLHVKRALTRLERNVRGFPESIKEDDGLFLISRLKVSKRYLHLRNDLTRALSFDVFINRQEDMAPVLDLIWAQHNEDWLCRPLRACLIHMFLHRDDYHTKIVIVAIRRHRYEVNNDTKLQTSTLSAKSCDDGSSVKEGDLVACELGFIIGDVYCSMTGAYSVNGAGLLQLAVTGEALRAAGCKVWDLGMMMPYKKELLGCVSISRRSWVQLVRERQDAHGESTTAERIEQGLRERYEHGVPVLHLLA